MPNPSAGSFPHLAAAGGSWYPGRYTDPVELNEPALTQAVEKCHAAIEEASEEGRLGPERLAILGFSQGACLSIEYALRHPGRCNTLIVLTGALMGLGAGMEAQWKAKGKLLEGTNIFLTGSDADDWIAEPHTLQTAAFLAELGADLTLRNLPRAAAPCIRRRTRRSPGFSHRAL